MMGECEKPSSPARPLSKEQDKCITFWLYGCSIHEHYGNMCTMGTLSPLGQLDSLPDPDEVGRERREIGFFRCYSGR